MRTLLKVILVLLFVVAPLHGQSVNTLLDTLQHTTFDFFWNEANPANGLIKDRSTPGSPASIASVGFGLTAICIGVDHGWVTRQAAKDRVATTLQTFWQGPQGLDATGCIGYKGFFYHFLEMGTATRAWTSELSTIDTGLLLAGIIDVKQYFTGTDPTETLIRALADSLYRRMNWNWFRNYHPGILMQWTPEQGFSQAQWSGYNEASIMYILALGSPTFPIDYTGWQEWTYNYSWQTWYGQSYLNFPPLFGHQYSHCWIDFRNIADAYMGSRGITYFENSRRATLAQRAYSIANPLHHVGYSDSLWGITASDVPGGYAARGAPPAQNDDGTISPTAPIGSLPFAPEAVLPVIWNMWNNYRPNLWMKYGFRDAFNLESNWFDTDVIGIDQGPIIIMIENYRNQTVWSRFMQNQDVQRGLQAAGFSPIVAVKEEPVTAKSYMLFQNYPNPFNGTTTIRYMVPSEGHVRIRVFDLLGREVAIVLDEERPAGLHSVVVDADSFASGVYTYRLEKDNVSLSKEFILVK
jgi:hypothetical protein